MQTEAKQIYKLASKAPNIISLMLLSAFAAMGAIIMTPALPAIADFFGRSVGTTQLAVTSFLLGYALGQLIYGPIANRHGRKIALYIGIAIATLGSLFSILSLFKSSELFNTVSLSSSESGLTVFKITLEKLLSKVAWS